MKGLLVISILYLVFCFSTYKHFGITSDEYVEYQSGKALLHYYQTGEEPDSYNIAARHKPTGSAYFRGHLALFSYFNPQGAYEKFHLFNMLFALPVFFVSYILLLIVYKNNWIAGFGTLALFINPRFLGSIPANTKDIPFAVLFFVSLGAIYLFEKMKLPLLLKIVTLGILFGLTFAFRALGVSLLLIYFLYSIRYKSELSTLRDCVLIAFFSFLVLIVSLPLFTTGIAEGFKTLLASNSSFEYWNNTMLFGGEFITKDERPWYYLPLWLAITTPLYVFLPFLASPVLMYLRKGSDNKLYVLLYLALFTNFVLYLLIEPVIYNGPRHFLFLFPIITFISILTTFDFWEHLKKSRPKIRYFLAFGIWATFLLATISFSRLHPYQYLYFNEFIGGLKGAQGVYDSDYWGASYKETSEWVRENFARKNSITVYSCDMPFAVDYYSQKLFQVVFEERNADFILCDLDNAIQKAYNFPVIYSVVREGATLNVVLDHRGFKPKEE